MKSLGNLQTLKISPIEVKSGKNFTINSLNKFIKKYKQFLDTAYVIHTGDYRQEKILNIC